MPEIARFFGIVIKMNFNDHVPPHFHARYGEQNASIEIATGDVYEGWLSPRPRRLVAEWARQHRAELFANWRLNRTGIGPRPIAPLE